MVGVSGISNEADEPVYDIAKCAVALSELSKTREIKWDSISGYILPRRGGRHRPKVHAV